MKWKTHGPYFFLPTSLPGVKRLKGGGYWARGKATSPKTGISREVSRVGFETKKAAYDWLQAELAAVRSACRREAQPRIQMKSFAASLLERKQANGDLSSAKTVRTWADALRLHINPALGDFFVDAITRADIEHWKDQIAWRFKIKAKRRSRKHLGGKISPVTANGWLRVLRVIMAAATLDHDLPKNPMLGVDDFDVSTHRTYTREQPNSLKPEHVPLFLDAMRRLHPPHFAMVLLGIATGLRPSSMRPLRRRGPTADVDWERGLVLVRRSHTVKRAVMEKTKTGADQELPLPPALLELLREHADELDGANTQASRSDLLFPSRTGGFRSASCLDKPFAEAAKAVGIKYRITPHGMRRTNKDMNRIAGVSDIVSRAVSGHATEEMHRHYSTVREGEMRDGIARVVELAGFEVGKRVGKSK